MFTVTKEWIHVIATEYYKEHYYKVCNRNGRCTEIHLVSKNNDYSNWELMLEFFPAQEYHLMYGNGARFWFSDLYEAQEHMDEFLVKLEKLIVFL
jgi:hypothetical protein